MATCSCPSSSTSTCGEAGSSGEFRQRRPDDAQQFKGFVRVPPALCGRPTGQLPQLTRLTQLRQRHPDDAQQLQGLAGLFGEPFCVGIIVLACDPCSHSEQESALVRDLG
jgi:hypothetical protein